jgi:hypothetical protein
MSLTVALTGRLVTEAILDLKSAWMEEQGQLLTVACLR